MKKFIALLVCIRSVFYADAQMCSNDESCRFRPGWYITASAGGNINIAEGNETWIPHKLTALSLKENGGFTARVGGGYDLTTVLGLRCLLVYNVHKWPDVRFRNPDGSFKEVIFKDGNATLDLTVNLSNWWAGYNPDRFISFTAFGGLGLAYREKADFPTDLYSWLVKGGGQADIRLSHRFDLSLAIHGNIVTDRFNNYVVHTPFELQTAFTAGVNYHFR
ncbi:MAG TPA: hypothetical protein VFK73_03100 [Paludibacter sp.]|nr:hypothetical protein [Paludibacter sp.]